MELQSYLKSNKAVSDYATLAFGAGNNGKDFQKQWLEKLDNAGVITQDVNEADLVPLKIISAIETAVEEDVVFSQFKPVFNIEAGSIVIEPKNTVGALVIIVWHIRLFNIRNSKSVTWFLWLFTSCNVLTI